MNAIVLIILSIVIALVLLKVTRKLIKTALFIGLVSVVFFALKHYVG